MNEDFSVILVTEDKKQMLVQHHCLPSTSDLSKLLAYIIEKASQDKEEVFVGSGRRSGTLQPPSKTSSLSCEAFSICNMLKFLIDQPQ